MAERTEEGALVLFSGGQDSTTCLAWALDRFARVETVGFAYGQRHAVELDCRPAIRAVLERRWPERLGPDHVLDIAAGLRALGDTAMTAEMEITAGRRGLPTTFVPGRNLLFLTYAGALAVRRGLRRLVGGMCETDFSGYPDCRDDTVKAMQVALNLGLDARLAVDTPLMWLDKAATWDMADRLGIEDTVTELTHTCYRGDRTRRHAWGYGCDACPACRLRADGFARWRAAKAGGMIEQHIIHDLLRRYGYGAIGLVVGLESMGLPLPGETLLVAAALYAVATDRLDISLIVLSAALGAVVGDNAGYAVGRYYGAPLLRRHGHRIGLTPRRLILGQYLFLHYGAAVVFLGRFTALLRAFAALMAGANQMSWGRFLVWNAAGGIAWSGLMGYGAYLLGARILKFAAPVGIAIGVGTVVAAAGLAWVLHRKGMAMEDRAVEAMAARHAQAEAAAANRPAV